MKRISIIFLVSVYFISCAYTTYGQNGQVFAAVKKGANWGFIDTLGVVQIPFTMEGAKSFTEGLAPVKYGKYWGYINKKGTFVFKPVFKTANNFHNGHGLISFFDPDDSAVFSGYINRLGNMTTIFEAFESGSDYHDGLAKILSADVNGRAIGFKDSSDNWVIKPHYDEATDFHEGLAAVQIGTKWGFIDRQNNYTVFPEYTDAWHYQEGVAYVKKENSTSYVNPKGKVLFTVKYDEVDLVMQEGLIAYRDKGKLGFMDAKGKTVIKAQFGGTNLSRFQDGLASVTGENGKTGFINKTGVWVIPPKFDDADAFFNNLAAAQINGKYGYISRKGEWVVQPQYDKAYEFEPADE